MIRIAIYTSWPEEAEDIIDILEAQTPKGISEAVLKKARDIADAIRKRKKDEIQKSSGRSGGAEQATADERTAAELKRVARQTKDKELAAALLYIAKTLKGSKKQATHVGRGGAGWRKAGGNRPPSQRAESW